MTILKRFYLCDFVLLNSENLLYYQSKQNECIVDKQHLLKLYRSMDNVRLKSISASLSAFHNLTIYEFLGKLFS